MARNRRGLNQIHFENGKTKESENKTKAPTNELEKEGNIDENQIKGLKITEKGDLKLSEKELGENSVEGKEQADKIEAS